jgi:hypothetical protein
MPADGCCYSMLCRPAIEMGSLRFVDVRAECGDPRRSSSRPRPAESSIDSVQKRSVMPNRGGVSGSRGDRGRSREALQRVLDNRVRLPPRPRQWSRRPAFSGRPRSSPNHWHRRRHNCRSTRSNRGKPSTAAARLRFCACLAVGDAAEKSKRAFERIGLKGYVKRLAPGLPAGTVPGRGRT